MDINFLDHIFKTYGYELKDSSSDYRIYVLLQGMYYGAEIIPLTNNDLSEVVEQYSKLGYACNINKLTSEDEIETYLFKGFFQTKLADKKIEKRYSDFAKKQIKHYGDSNVKYQYINVPYISNDIDKTNHGDDSIILDVNNILKRKGAYLIIIEAAAGFGKTCTAFELFYSFKNRTDSIKPLFTELSRNREAKRFKYVLWSEIEAEYNSLIKSNLVIYNIQKGRIPLIIDGFDELLSKNIDSGKGEKINDFEQVETMLSTIGELLKGDAKIILTSRKTAIFSGEDFNTWVESYSNTFSVIRFQIEKPEVKHWLSTDRFEALNNQQVPLEHISNPVLLTYLKNIPDSEFKILIKEPNSLIDKYFEYLLTREQERQHLYIPPVDQLTIFKKLSKDFTLFNVTCDNRNFVKELIIDDNEALLKKYRLLTPNKPTIEELADTLTNHALLDRVGNNDYVGFINEFVFGILLGNVLIENENFLKEENSLPEELIEQAITAFNYQTSEKKIELWSSLIQLQAKISISLKMLMDINLRNQIFDNFKSRSFNSLTFTKVLFINESCTFVDCIFTDSKFEDCIFQSNVFTNTSFIGCKFINCSIDVDTQIMNNENCGVYCYGCEDFDSKFIKEFSCNKNRITNNSNEESPKDYQQIILSKFFRVDGKTPRMKLISTLKDEISEYDREKAFEIFHKLKKEGYIRTNGNNSHISPEGIIFYNKTYR